MENVDYFETEESNVILAWAVGSILSVLQKYAPNHLRHRNLS